MRIKHPDTFICDICGREVGESDIEKGASVYALSDSRINGAGELEKTEARTLSVKLDLCFECIEKVVRVREVPDRVLGPKYELIEEES